MSEVTQFHNLSHIFISFIGAVLLLAIYYNIRKRFYSVLEDGNGIKRVDKGLLYTILQFWNVSVGVFRFMGAHC